MKPSAATAKVPVKGNGAITDLQHLYDAFGEGDVASKEEQCCSEEIGTKQKGSSLNEPVTLGNIYTPSQEYKLEILKKSPRQGPSSPSVDSDSATDSTEKDKKIENQKKVEKENESENTGETMQDLLKKLEAKLDKLDKIDKIEEELSELKEAYANQSQGKGSYSVDQQSTDRQEEMNLWRKVFLKPSDEGEGYFIKKLYQCNVDFSMITFRDGSVYKMSGYDAKILKDAGCDYREVEVKNIGSLPAEERQRIKSMEKAKRMSDKEIKIEDFVSLAGKSNES